MSSWDGEGAQNPLFPPYRHQGDVTPLPALGFSPSLKPSWSFPCCCWCRFGVPPDGFLPLAASPLGFFSSWDFFLPLSGTGSAKAQSCLTLCQLLSTKKGGALQSLACRWGHDVLGHLLHHLIAPFPSLSRPFIFSTQALGREGRKIKALPKKALLHGTTREKLVTFCPPSSPNLTLAPYT